MKLRPHIQLRLRDAAQFDRLQAAKSAVGLSVNEYILRALESKMVEDLYDNPSVDGDAVEEER
jgi:hypothetical protein